MLLFDVDDAFLSNSPINGKYSVTIEVTYLDKGKGGWQLYYDAAGKSNKSSITVSCNNTNQWKKATVTINDAYFGNRGKQGSDFYIKSTSKSENVIFSVVELSRPANFASQKIANSIAAENIQLKTTDDKLIVNPNPVSNNFYIQSKNNETINQVNIYNAAGQLVLQKKVSASRLNINRSEMGSKAGTYFVKVFTASGVFSTKIIIL